MSSYNAAMLLGLLLFITAECTQAQSEAAAFQVVQETELTWMSGPNGLGAQFAVVHGDSAKREGETMWVRVHD